MQVEIKFNPIDYKRLQTQLATTYKATGITVRWLCWDQMRLACADAIKFMAPWSSNQAGTKTAQRKVGEGAAEKDIDRLFARIDREKYAFWDVKVQKMGKKGKLLKRKVKTGEKMARNKATGKIFKIEADKWNRDDIEAIHKKYRNKKGRVQKQDRQYWVKKSSLKRYIRETKKHVGRLKASWLSAYNFFSSKVGGGKRFSAWVTRHGTVGGAYINGMTDSGNGKLVASSLVPHNISIRKDTMRYISNTRQQHMAKYGAKRMQQIADQFNANRTTIQPIRQNAIE